MGNNNNNTIVAFLLIAVIIGVGILLGNNVLTGTDKEVYYDFNNMDLLNVSDIEIIDTGAYNSLKFDNNFSLVNTIAEKIDFQENLSGVKEYEIELQVDFSNMEENTPSGLWFLWSFDLRDIENNMSNFNTQYLDDNLLSYMGFRSSAISVDLSTEPTSSLGNLNFQRTPLGNQGIYNVKYTFNLENTGNEYIIEELSFDYTDASITDLKEFKIIMLSDEMAVADLWDNANFGFLMENIGGGAVLDNDLSNNSSFVIDFIKLTYEPIEVE